MDDNSELGSGSSSIPVTSSQSKSQKRKRRCDNDEEINAYLENRYRTLIPGAVLRKYHEDLIEKVKRLVKTRYLNSKVKVYGSVFSGTDVISSDIDLAVYVKTDSPDHTIEQISKVLEKGNFKGIKERRADDRIGLFFHYEDGETKTFMDLTLNNRVARKASKLIQSIVDVDISIKIVVVLIKEFSKCYNINDHKKGKLASIGYTYMFVFVLQLNNLLPMFINKTAAEITDLIAEADAYKIKFDEVCKGNTSTLHLLRSFFHYYNYDFDFDKDAISILGGEVVSKQSLGWAGGEQKYTLAIVDPFGDGNIGRTVSYGGMEEIKKAFKAAEGILAGSRPHDLFKPQDSRPSGIKSPCV